MQATPLAAHVEPSHISCLLDGYTPLISLWVLGAQVIGNNISWLLVGFLTAQTYTFYTRSARDPTILKILVYSLVFLIGVGETAVEGYVEYIYLVSGWGNPDAENDDLVPLFAQSDLQPIFDAIPAIAVQLFFTWRIWKFCQAVWGKTARRFVAALCLLIGLMSICGFASAIFLYVEALVSTGTNNRFYVALMMWTIQTAVVDVLITACMMVILYHAKSSANFGETRDKISRMLRLTIQTGFLTCILAIPIIPLYLLTIQGWNLFTCFLLGKSYVLTLLFNLNNRSSQPPEANSTTGVFTSHLSTLAFTAGQSPAASATNGTSSKGIFSFTRSVTRTVRHVLSPIQIEDRESGSSF